MRILRTTLNLAANAKFRIKLIVSYCLLVTFIILILGFAYYQISARNMLQNVQESLGNIVLNNNQLLDEKLLDIQAKSEVLPIDNELYQVIMSVDQRDNESKVKADRRITSILFQYFGGDSDIYSSFILTPEYAYGNAARMYVPPDGFFQSDLYRMSIMNQGDLVWVPTYSFADTFGEQKMKGFTYEYEKLISGVKELNLTYIDEQGVFHALPADMRRPVLMLSFRTEYVEKLFADYVRKSKLQHLTYGVVDAYGSVIVASDEQLAGTRQAPSWIKEAFELGTGSFEKVIDGRKRLISFHRMESTGWMSYIEIPVEDALSDLKSLRYYSILFLAAMLFVSVLLAYLLSIYITKPIIRIKKAIKMMELGNFRVRIPEHGRDELGELIRMFNQMNGQIHTLIEENYASRLREKEAELMALNLQLNPHFLYNTLTTLYWIAVENNQQEMSKIMLNLAEMLQTSTRNKNETWPLATDLDWLNKYIYIMSSRFENVIETRIDVDEELLDLDVPKLFLQPFVENAIIHGLAEFEEGGSIVIRGWSGPDAIYFTVEDNGCGIPKDRLEKLRRGEVRSTGMANVEKRIKLLYGASYGVDIQAGKEQGTRIVIRLGRRQGPGEATRIS
ncbi:two-component system sensor histidine kinase YesM [Paenibacillus phyllosphaerae]|uniref:Two-component system sensor histidine kinase YesM n=1 Tax=Paenibacillus phyllosphaerae TaxID=274593 RepID=A0A7W5AWG9_9BACL|nr:histidine kinase [Paenibacillus phyllosphaerae]MBB3110089.1 two-component system sensor histidine kinase YesM [Paenibacillus phyllosphaerae]